MSQNKYELNISFPLELNKKILLLCKDSTLISIKNITERAKEKLWAHRTRTIFLLSIQYWYFTKNN